MDKKDWGVKRVCLGCGARFYDFNKSPIICPSCGDVYDAEYLSKRKSKPMSEKEDEDIIIDDDIIPEDEDIVSLDEESEDNVVSLDDDDSKE